MKDSKNIPVALGFLTSKIAQKIINILNPTMVYQVGNVKSLFKIIDLNSIDRTVIIIAQELIRIHKEDWDLYERSWDFQQLHLLRNEIKEGDLKNTYLSLRNYWENIVEKTKQLEEKNNQLFIDYFKLTDEITNEIQANEITLTCNPDYRFGLEVPHNKREERIRYDTLTELISYIVGCMMGRYSLDEPGLIYAHAGNQDFDTSRYQTFPADADGIIPLTEVHWFEDDATHRIREFLTAVWGKDTLDANMLWLAESLDKKASETAEDTIRRYLASKFYKDHMQTYKKRPIYWLFSSGKQGAFQALVYLHRYNESTLARMRTEYVMPLISKMAAMVNSLQSEIENSDSAAEIKRKEKELQNLHKQQAELSSFEEKLRHYADQRISLDLDDGVKVNYGKFGDLLAEVKAVTGEK